MIEVPLYYVEKAPTAPIARGGRERCTALISHNVLIKWIEKVNSPTKTVNLLFCLVKVNNELTILWGSRPFNH